MAAPKPLEADEEFTGRHELQNRNATELVAAVASHRRLRAAHPVPAGWTEDASGLLAAPGEVRGHEPDPFVILSHSRRRQTRRSAAAFPLRLPAPRLTRTELAVYVDYFFRGHVNVTFSDWSEQGLTAEEVRGLMFDLLRLDVPLPVVADAVDGAVHRDGWYFDLLLPDPLPSAGVGKADGTDDGGCGEGTAVVTSPGIVVRPVLRTSP